MPEAYDQEKENILSRRLNKIFETRLENDQVLDINYFSALKILQNILFRILLKPSKNCHHSSLKTPYKLDEICAVRLKRRV